MNKIFTCLACTALLLFGFYRKCDAQCSLTISCTSPPDTVCDLTLNNPQLWNEPYWWDGVITSHDLAEGPSDLCITATDTCAGASLSLRYLLFLDLDGDGALETVVDSDNLPPSNTVHFNNAGNPGYSGGTARAFDERPVPGGDQYGFSLETTATSASNTSACVRWRTSNNPGNFVVPELPLGKHKIRWIATNGLGDTTVCERSFTVRDCKAPTVVCQNNLSVNIMPTQLITLWATDFLQYAEDNVTPPTPYTNDSQLKFAVRKSGTGSGFPIDGFGQPVTSVTFGCDEMGTQPIELWAEDAAGNANYCSTNVIVQDGGNFCEWGWNASINVCAKEHCNNQIIEGVQFTLVGVPPDGLPSITVWGVLDTSSCLLFVNALPYSTDYTVTPVKDDNPMNGVSTFDLVLMSKHILGIEPLSSPYKIIAADINKSNSVTTFDVVELRKLILGTYSELPNNTSWRFIDKAYTFNNPNNPFQNVPFPENVSVSDVQSNQTNDFVGIKIGDLNCSAIPNVLGPTGITLSDRLLAPGEIADIPVSVAEPGEWLGFQFALQFDPEALVIEAVEPGPLPALSADGFGVFSGRVASSWAYGAAQAVAPGTPLFTLRVRALKPVALHDALQLESGNLAPEAYTGGENLRPLMLAFTSAKAGEGPAVFAPQPNPTHAGATLPLTLPTAAEARLEVFDLTGKMLFVKTVSLEAGFQTLDIPAIALPESGLYIWQASLNEHHFSGKIIRQ